MKEAKSLMNFRLPETLTEDLKEVSEKTGSSISQIVRDALWEKVAEIRKTHPAYNRPDLPVQEVVAQ